MSTTLEFKPSFLWVILVIILKKRLFALGFLSLNASPMVHKKFFIDSAMPNLVEMYFLSIFMDNMLMVLDFLVKTLLISFHVLLRSPSQKAILRVKYSRHSSPFSLLASLRTSL